jgi:hypothetical protein
MLATDESRLYRVQDDGTALDIEDTIVERGWGFGLANMLPDLSDPATLGCLLALVREVHGAASVVYLPRDGAIRAWRVVTFAHGADWLTPARCLGEGATEAEALVAALESVPGGTLFSCRLTIR